jgi:hypothetical protein
MKLILALPAVGLLFSGLTFLPKSPAVSAPATPTGVDVKSPEIWSNKGECFKNETFNLYFAQPHASTLGVVDPDGKFFYLVFPAACAIGELKPLMSSEDFEHCSSITINPATLKADPYIYGVMENRPVFTKSGVYRFVLGDNLHVDDETVLNIVPVLYHRKSRPSPAMVMN